MQLIVKHFNDLSTLELFEILKLRMSVFVVEQNCPFQDIDDADKVAFHVYLQDENGIQAYVRVLPKGATFDDVSIGRVISIKRRCGLGSQILYKGIEVAKEKFNAKKITIEAQTYARKLYENQGFVQVSDEFLVDNLPHMIMTLRMDS